MSQRAVEFILKDGEIVHEDFRAVAKEVREDHDHTLLECRGGIT